MTMPYMDATIEAPMGPPAVDTRDWYAHAIDRFELGGQAPRGTETGSGNRNGLKAGPGRGIEQPVVEQPRAPRSSHAAGRVIKPYVVRPGSLAGLFGCEDYARWLSPYPIRERGGEPFRCAFCECWHDRSQQRRVRRLAG